MKKSNMRIGAGMLAIGLLIFTACSDDSKSSSSNPASAAAATNINFSGTYTGNYTYVSTNKQSGQMYQEDSTGMAFTISGSSPNFTLALDGSPNESVSIVGTGNTFAGANGTGFFAGSNYTGQLDGDLLNLREVGEDSDDSWQGSFTGSRPAGSGGGGGGGGCNAMSVSGSVVGAFQSGNCGTEYDAGFASNQAGYIWHLSIAFDEDCDYGVSDGTYTIISDGNQSQSGSTYAVVELDLEHTGGNPDLITLASNDHSGNLLVANVNGKLRVTASNIALSEGSSTRTVSFCVEI